MERNKLDNNEAREIIFDKFNILDEIKKNWVYKISASVISPIREARLMTKFDHKDNIPKIFAENGLSILPINRWTYLIWHFETHKDISYDNTHIQNIEPRNDLESLDRNNLFSESLAIDYAFVSKMFEKLLNEIFEPTISGRMGSWSFSFKVLDNESKKQRVIEVNNAQVEIDGGFESKSKLMIIEAKMWKRDDFIVRQLYYPYRLRKQRVNKEVVPVFMTVSNDIFTFFVYKFNDDNDYNSIELVSQKSFTINFEPITIQEVKDILKRVELVSEPDVPFPQADDFEKVINLLEILQSWEKTDDELTEEYNFVKRQAHYYKSASKYLWYADCKHWGPLELTTKWKNLMELPRRERLLHIIEDILSHPVFKETLIKYLNENWNISNEDIVKIMINSRLKNIWTISTFRRRWQTIKWRCNWIIQTTKESE